MSREFSDFQALIEQALRLGAFRFEPTLVSDQRLSPYFFNSGVFNAFCDLDSLTRRWFTRVVELIEDGTLDIPSFCDDIVFLGIAEKGIAPAIALGTSMYYEPNFNGRFRFAKYAFFRKHPKGHGEGGEIVGASLSGMRVKQAFKPRLGCRYAGLNGRSKTNTTVRPSSAIYIAP